MFYILISLLYKYPEFRGSYHIPEAYKSQAELLNYDEIKEPSRNFVAFTYIFGENSE
ncbi:unnamed protein product, partial [Rotaria sp. Silwood2]